ncbi:nicotinate phosphoribosyltransferase, partial [Clavibacter californiensis]
EGGEPDPRWLGRQGTAAAREHHSHVVRALPPQAFRLRAGDPAIPTEEGATA